MIDTAKTAINSLTDYHAKYFVLELTKRCPSNSIEKLTASLMDAQVDLNPHQVEAALFAFKSPLSRGALLADEVGLGKTIEAGLVISQKWAERKRKILIIVPSNLRKQWNQELLDKFFLPSCILEAQSYRKMLKEGARNPFRQDCIVICSYHFARKMEMEVRGVDWDLVVIDEAHRLRNVYKPSNKIANAIKEAISGRPIILMTATPLQNNILELYGLAGFIDEHAFGDIKSFKSQYSRIESQDEMYDDLKRRLAPLCIRTLRKQVLEYIKYTSRISITQDFIPTRDEQDLYDMVSAYLQRKNLRALPSSQRNLMILVIRKILASSTFAIAGTLYSLEKRLISNLEKIKKYQKIDDKIDDSIDQDFEGLEELKDEWEEETPEDAPDRLNIKALEKEIEELNTFRLLAESITENAKGNALLAALKGGFKKAEELGAKRKAIIFTESRRTQEYLLRLFEDTEYKGHIVLFNGMNNDSKSKEIYKEWLEKHRGTSKVSGSKTADIRSALVEYFEKQAQIMIATEAAAEGINLQFCSLVVNYDLPWNPQRIEQRIGRCHRYGQKHDVVVVNFLNRKNAADQRVFELLAQKFALFEGVFGASDEVLGVIESGVDFEKRIMKIYQECRTPDEIQASFDELQRELETQIDENMKTTRHKLLENFDEEVHEKLRINLQESKRYLNKYENLLWDLTRYFLKPHAVFGTDEHSFELKRNPFENKSIYSGKYVMGRNVEDAYIYRLGHPLAQGVIRSCIDKKLPPAEIVFDYSNCPKKITILEELVGKSGVLSLSRLTVTALEDEDYIIFAGLCDDGKILDEEQSRRLFSLPGKTTGSNGSLYRHKKIDEIIEKKKAEIIGDISSRNSVFFDEEMEKLDKWAEDVKNGLEMQLKEIEREIKLRKTEARKIGLLNEKIMAQKEIKEMEKKRSALRRDLFSSQDDVDNRKENLIDEVEKRLKQSIEFNQIFFLRWKLV